jgi:hypothetical protein
MIRKMLRPDEIRRLSQPSAARSLRSLFFDWVLIAGNFALAI